MDTTGNTKTKDISHLHLYLGCEGMASIIYSFHPVVKKEVSAKLFSLDVNGKIQCQCRDVDGIDWEDTTVLLIDDFKPILRPLSDMTEQEYNVWENGVTGEISSSTTDIMKEEARKVKYLLSKNFDLFQLIENGLAIDKYNPS